MGITTGEERPVRLIKPINTGTVSTTTKSSNIPSSPSRTTSYPSQMTHQVEEEVKKTTPVEMIPSTPVFEKYELPKQPPEPNKPLSYKNIFFYHGKPTEPIVAQDVYTRQKLTKGEVVSRVGNPLYHYGVHPVVKKKTFFDFLGYTWEQTRNRFVSYFSLPDITRRLDVSFNADYRDLDKFNKDFMESEEQNYQENLRMWKDKDWGGLAIKYVENPLVNAPLFYGGTLGLGAFSQTTIGSTPLFMNKSFAITPSHFLEAGTGSAFAGYTGGGLHKTYVEGGLPALRQQIGVTILTLPAYMDIGRSGYYRGQELGLKYRGPSFKSIINKPLYMKTVGTETYPVSTKTLINRFTNKIDSFKIRSSNLEWESWGSKYGIESKYKPQTIWDYVSSKIKPNKVVQRNVGKNISYSEATNNLLNKMFKPEETSSLFREKGFEIAQFKDTGEVIIRKIKPSKMSNLTKSGLTFENVKPVRTKGFEKIEYYPTMRELGLPQEPITDFIKFSSKEIKLINKKLGVRTKGLKISEFGKIDILRSPDSDIVSTKFKKFYGPMKNFEKISKDTRTWYERNKMSPGVKEKYKITEDFIAKMDKINENALEKLRSTKNKNLKSLKINEVKKFGMKPLDIRFYGQDVVKQIKGKKTSLRFYASSENAGLPVSSYDVVERVVPHKSHLNELVSFIEPKAETVVSGPRKVLEWKPISIEGSPLRMPVSRGGRGGIWASMFGYSTSYDMDEEIISKQWSNVAPVYISKPKSSDVLGLDKFLRPGINVDIGIDIGVDVIRNLNRGNITGNIVIQDVASLQKRKTKQITESLEDVASISITETIPISVTTSSPFIPRVPKKIVYWDDENNMLKKFKKNYFLKMFGIGYRFRKHKTPTLSQILGGW